MPKLHPWGEGSDAEEESVIAEQMSPDPNAEGRLYDLTAAGPEQAPRLPRLDQVLLVADTAGMRGKASGSARTREPVRGRILAVHLRYHPSAPTTTDVHIRTVPRDGRASQTILAVPEAHVDGYFAPDSEPVWRPLPRTFSYVPFEVDDVLELVVTESDELSGAVVARVIFEQD